jgi:hypothetical protein
MWCVRDLDFKSMTNLSYGSTKLDKTQCKIRSTYVESFSSSLTCMALVGIQALSYRNSSYKFFMFSKDKSSEL